MENYIWFLRMQNQFQIVFVPFFLIYPQAYFTRFLRV